MRRIRSLCCARADKRPRSRAAESRNELAPSHSPPAHYWVSCCATAKLAADPLWVSRVGLIRRRRSRHVRFVPQSGHRELVSTCPLSAISDRTQRSKTRALLDHLVGDGQQPGRDGEAERFRRLQVDDKLELG